jgi:hypothetical protein
MAGESDGSALSVTEYTQPFVGPVPPVCARAARDDQTDQLFASALL